MSEPLLRVENLHKRFPIKGGIFSRTVASVDAVSGVSFEVYRGETLGLVGESGCGKTTLGRSVLRLLDPTSGRIFYDGREISHLPEAEMRPLRRKMQVIFQDPYASLNPRLTVERTIGEAIDLHGLAASAEERRARIVQLLKLCGMREDVLKKYPHEFSGGQRQRICIARALAVEPEFLVCDEPVSALDVSIQAQVINLLQDLQDELQLTTLFIAHDLKVVEHISDRIAVMYLGQIVEMGEAEALYQKPRHPYTGSLLSSIPSSDPAQRQSRKLLQGDVPSPINPPKGCRFHTRCPKVQAKCRSEAPKLDQSGESEPGRLVACFYPE